MDVTQIADPDTKKNHPPPSPFSTPPADPVLRLRAEVDAARRLPGDVVAGEARVDGAAAEEAAAALALPAPGERDAARLGPAHGARARWGSTSANATQLLWEHAFDATGSWDTDDFGGDFGWPIAGKTRWR